MNTDDPNNRLPPHKHINIKQPRIRTPDDDLRELRADNDSGSDVSRKVMLGLGIVLGLSIVLLIAVIAM